jgi:hypothetical protein
MGGGWAGLRRETATLVRGLELDGAGAEVISALEAVGVSPILLKGPALADWLYQGEIRSYGDVDLLIAPPDVPAAEQLLTGLGFQDEMQGASLCERSAHAATWSLDALSIDLHHTVVGATLTDADVWRELSNRCELHFVGGREVNVLEPPALACLCALHAAQHGRNEPKPLEDLRRALEAGTDELWREALKVAIMIGALAAFAAGLRLVAEGKPVARALGLSHAAPIDVLIRAESSPFLVHGFQQFIDTPGVWKRAQTLGRKLVPTPAGLRASSALARRGGWALVLAYLLRPIRIAVCAIPGLVRWARLRRLASR